LRPEHWDGHQLFRSRVRPRWTGVGLGPGQRWPSDRSRDPVPAAHGWHREAADDLVQETLLRALASAHLWQPGSSLRAWLVTIMRNQFLATLSRAKRSQAATEMLDVAEGVGAHVEIPLTLRDVERAFHRLPQKQRAAVFLAGIEGKSYSEVAIAMGVTADAVRCHLARARARLRSAVYEREETSWVRPAPDPAAATLG
jgi:RNA polymerase sigma-70 factor, ECF subfamily